MSSIALFTSEAWYKLWFKKFSNELSETVKLDLAKRISELTLRSPIWTDTETNYIDQFPELKPYSNNGKISGLQLVAVMSCIVEEFQVKARSH